MRIMKNLLPLLFLCFSFHSFAQYVPMAQGGQQWNILDRVNINDSYTFIYKVEGDSLIDGQYRKVLSQADSSGFPAVPYGYFIEDSSAQTVIIDFFDTALQRVIYDFSLMPGDTFHYQCRFMRDSSGYLYLDSIRMVNDSTGQPRRKFHFTNYNSINQGQQISWVEGLGSTDNFLFNFVPCVLFKTTPFAQTLCISDSSNRILYDNPNYSDCIEQEVSLAEQLPLNIGLYPNPVADRLGLSGPYNSLLNRPYVIINSQGQKVEQGRLAKPYLDIRHLQSGIYILKIQDYNPSLRWLKL